MRKVSWKRFSTKNNDESYIALNEMSYKSKCDIDMASVSFDRIVYINEFIEVCSAFEYYCFS